MQLKQLTVEAIVVGFVTLIGSYVFDLRKKLHVFMMGVLIHLCFELVGANRYYCKHGAACR